MTSAHQLPLGFVGRVHVARCTVGTVGARVLLVHGGLVVELSPPEARALAPALSMCAALAAKEDQR